MSPALRALSLAGLLAACAPPPVPTDNAPAGESTDGGSADDGGAATGGGDETDGPPTVTVLFPQTREDVVICPTFVAVVDIDNLELTDYSGGIDNVDGQGHWHLYDSDDYLGAFVDPWGLVALDNDGTEQRHILTASLAENDHTPLLVEATVEIIVGPEGCIGGAPGTGEAGDTGAG